jgi:hypothetical protein
MTKIASEALVERFAEWGVDTVFGLPGDGINGIMEARAATPGSRAGGCDRQPRPPMPGRVQYERAKGLAKAFAAGQPRRSAIVSRLARDKFAELKHR